MSKADSKTFSGRRVLIFGAGLQTLSLSRGLKSHGYEVVNMGDAHSVGRYARGVDQFIERDLSALGVEDFGRLLGKLGVTLVIPTEDEYAEWLSHHKPEIESRYGVKCACEDEEKLQFVINKGELMEYCRTHGIPHPRTMKLTHGNIDECAAHVGFPALVKPDVSNGSRGITLVNDLGELRARLDALTAEYGSASLQEFIANDSHYYNVMLYRYADGHYAPAVVTRITRFYPIKGGSSSYCTTIEAPELVAMCKRLLDALDWRGFADFDVLEKSPADWRIIEINPRVPASLEAARVSGVDFGAIIASDELRLPESRMAYKPGEALRCLGLDMAWFASSPRRFGSTPSWFRFFGRHLHYQDGGLYDLRAMAYSIWSGIRKQLSPEFRRRKAGMN